MKKRVLITGGAGFIGSHLAEKILNLGHEVIIIDNESTGFRENVPSAAEYVVGDVRNPSDLEPIFASNLDTVFHIAGQASTIRSFNDPLEDLNVNIVGTVNIIQKCIEYHVPRLLFASSMTAYGHVDSLPIYENMQCRPISYYGITKYAAERYVHASGMRNDLATSLKVTSFRMFNVYGERQRLDNPYQGVMGIFIGNVLRNEPIIIHGEGDQSRDFVHIDDVVNAWVSAWENPAAYGKVFNLGTGEKHSINFLVDTVLGVLEYNRPTYSIEYQSLRPGDQRHMVADITLIQSLLEWKPTIGFEEGVRRTVQWALYAYKSTEIKGSLSVG